MLIELDDSDDEDIWSVDEQEITSVVKLEERRSGRKTNVKSGYLSYLGLK